MEEIKRCRPAAKSIASGQVLKRPYSWEEGRVIVREMTEQMTLELVAKGYAAEGVTLFVGYESFGREGSLSYEGPVNLHFGFRARHGKTARTHRRAFLYHESRAAPV